MVITSVVTSKKHPSKFMVYLDNQYAFSLSADTYYSLDLYQQKTLTAEQVDYIKTVILHKAAKQAAIKYLSLKLRTGWEIARKLESEGYTETVICDVIEELTSMGYLNDRIYAQKFVYDRSKLKPKSKRILKLELSGKGISESVIDEVLDEFSLDESAVAESLVRRKYGKYDLSDEKVFRKVYAFLQHRGFSYTVITDVINKLCKS